MEDLIKYMIEKRNELLIYREELKLLANSNKEEHQIKIEKYNQIVDDIQNRISILKEIIINEFKNEFENVKRLSNSVYHVYPQNLENFIEEAEEAKKQSKELRKNQPYKMDSIQSFEKLIETLNSKIEATKDLMQRKKVELQELVPEGQSADEYLMELLEKIRKIDELTFKNLDEYTTKLDEKEKRGKVYITNENIIKNLSAVEEWCKEYFSDNTPKYLRRLPRMCIVEEGAIIKRAKPGEEETLLQIEYNRGVGLNRVNQSPLIKRYRNGTDNGVYTPEELQIIAYYNRIREEYDYNALNEFGINLLEIKDWCDNKFKDLPIYLRRRPRTYKTFKGLRTATAKERENGLESEKQKELRLGTALSNFRSSWLYNKYAAGEKLSKPEQDLIDLYNTIIKEYDISEEKANLLELKEWCEEKEKSGLSDRIETLLTVGIFSKKIRRTQRTFKDETAEEKRVRLGRAFNWFDKKSNFCNQYRDILDSEDECYREMNIPQEDIEMISLYKTIKGYFSQRSKEDDMDINIDRI